MAKVLWTQKQDIGPRPRVGHAMVFDAAKKKVLLFGGDPLDGTTARDTWEWDAENWTQVQDIGPSARTGHAMAYDSDRGRTVLFGGATAAGETGDTWEWDGQDWTQVADTGPPKRALHSMAFDSKRKRVVLFGGRAGAAFLNDTWEWNGTDWVQQADTGPSPRRSAAMAFDSSRGRVVLFGGGTVGPALGDTWEWDGSTWTQEADFGPDACAGGAMVFNGSVAVLFGGAATLMVANPPPALFSFSWEWDGKRWTARQDMGPGPRVFHAMAFDADRGRTVLFGGLPVPPGDPDAASRVLGDTWEQVGAAIPGGGGGETEPAGPTVVLASVGAVPNPVAPGQTTVVTVALAAPAPAITNVILTFGDQSGSISFNPGQSSATVSVPIPADLNPQQVEITASSGSSIVSTMLTIAGA